MTSFLCSGSPPPWLIMSFLPSNSSRKPLPTPSPLSLSRCPPFLLPSGHPFLFGFFDTCFSSRLVPFPGMFSPWKRLLVPIQARQCGSGSQCSQPLSPPLPVLLSLSAPVSSPKQGLAYQKNPPGPGCNSVVKCLLACVRSWVPFLTLPKRWQQQNPTLAHLLPFLSVLVNVDHICANLLVSHLSSPLESELYDSRAFVWFVHGESPVQTAVLACRRYSIILVKWVYAYDSCPWGA